MIKLLLIGNGLSKIGQAVYQQKLALVQNKKK